MKEKPLLQWERETRAMGKRIHRKRKFARRLKRKGQKIINCRTLYLLLDYINVCSQLPALVIENQKSHAVFEELQVAILEYVPSMVQWEKQCILGFGGSATVYKCKIISSESNSPRENDIVAVKEINKNGLSAQQCSVIDAEIDLLRNLSHPNVIHYIGTEYSSTHFYIFLEYAEGGSLRQLYLRNGPLEERVIIYFLQQILSGLLYLHLKVYLLIIMCLFYICNFISYLLGYCASGFERCQYSHYLRWYRSAR